MRLKIIKGHHLTQTERSAVKSMLYNGWTTATNSINTKSYEISNITPERFELRVGTKDVWTIGDIRRWKYSDYLVEYKN